MRAGGFALLAGFLAFGLIPSEGIAANNPGVMVTPAGIVTLPTTDQPEACDRTRDGSLLIQRQELPKICHAGSWRTLQIEEIDR